MAKQRLTIQELADKSGISTSGIKRWLAGVGEARSSNLQRVADALDVTWDWLLGLTDELPTHRGGAGAEGFGEQSGAGMAPASGAPLRLSKIVNLPRLVDAYSEARERLAQKADAEDGAQLMEMTLLLYDALTLSGDVMLAQARETPAAKPQEGGG